MAFLNDELVCVMPAHEDNKTLYSHNGLTYGGLVYSADLNPKQIALCLKSILQYLEQNNIETLHIKTIPQCYYNKPDLTLQKLYSQLNAEPYRSDVLSIVKPNEVSYSRDRKAGIKRGVKHNLVVQETDDLSQFWNDILIPNLKHKHGSLPVHSLDEITLLKSRFNKQIRQFNVYYNDHLVAGTTIFDTKNVARSQYMSSNHLKNKLGSLDFLHSHLLETVFKDKSFFDFGASNLDSGKKISEGLLYWKSGFGTKKYNHDFYKIETKMHTALDSVFN